VPSASGPRASRYRYARLVRHQRDSSSQSTHKGSIVSSNNRTYIVPLTSYSASVTVVERNTTLVSWHLGRIWGQLRPTSSLLDIAAFRVQGVPLIHQPDELFLAPCGPDQVLSRGLSYRDQVRRICSPVDDAAGQGARTGERVEECQPRQSPLLSADWLTQMKLIETTPPRLRIHIHDVQMELC